MPGADESRQQPWAPSCLDKIGRYSSKGKRAYHFVNLSLGQYIHGGCFKFWMVTSALDHDHVHLHSLFFGKSFSQFEPIWPLLLQSQQGHPHLLPFRLPTTTRVAKRHSSSYQHIAVSLFQHHSQHLLIPCQTPAHPPSAFLASFLLAQRDITVTTSRSCIQQRNYTLLIFQKAVESPSWART